MHAVNMNMRNEWRHRSSAATVRHAPCLTGRERRHIPGQHGGQRLSFLAGLVRHNISVLYGIVLYIAIFCSLAFLKDHIVPTHMWSMLSFNYVSTSVHYL